MSRRIEVEGCNNFRDLGGYPTRDGRRLRTGTLFRADGLHHLTPRGVATFRDDLGIRDVVDLRSSGEIRMDGRGALERESAIRFHHLPLFDGEISEEQRSRADDVSLGDRYLLMLRFAEAPIARVIETLARASGPAVFHCAAGKDRTGVISAVILGALDVADEVIVADYAATREGLEAVVERLMQSEGYRTMFEALPPDTLHAEPETMIDLLARVRDDYGSMRGYLAKAGVSDAVVDALAGRVLD
ncbi:MAG: tyrosine-protein phosphatase [Myxococcota bacterium]